MKSARKPGTVIIAKHGLPAKPVAAKGQEPAFREIIKPLPSVRPTP